MGSVLALAAMNFVAQFGRAFRQADLLAALDEAQHAVGVKWLLGLVFTGIVSRREWGALLRLEPESNPLFKRKHRKFQVVCAALIMVIVLICAIGLSALLR